VPVSITTSPPWGGWAYQAPTVIVVAMPVVDARVRVQHPCPYCDLSLEFPQSLLLLWCDNRRDTFMVSSPDPPELRRLTVTFRKQFRAQTLLSDGTSAILAVPDFEWDHPPSVTRLAREGEVWVLPPVVYSDGRETYRLLSPNRRRLFQLLRRLRRLGEVAVLSVSARGGLDTVREFPTASVHFFEGLTYRQLRALLAAHDGGLLEVPARSRWEEVARREGLGRSTFGEHLRKAQLRLVQNSYSVLRARAETSATPLVLPALAMKSPAADERGAGRTGPSRRGAPLLRVASIHRTRFAGRRTD
jgi:predicted DNA binding protein